MPTEYKPSYMNEEEDEKTVSSNPLQGEQNQLASETAPGTSTTTSTNTAPTSISNQSANIGTSSGSSVTPGQNKRSSGQFTNLQKYLTANKGADLAGNIKTALGSKISGSRSELEDRAGFASSEIDKNKATRRGFFGTQEDRKGLAPGIIGANVGESGGSTEDQTYTKIAGSAGQALDTLGRTGAQNQQAADLTQQEQTLTQARDFNYGGPQDFNLSGLESKRQDFDAAAKASSSAQGRFGLLQDMFGKEGYTRGQQKLDNLLLQGDEGSKEKLSDLRRDARSFGSNLDQTSSNIITQIAEEKAKTKDSVNSFAKQLGVTSEDLTADLEGRIGKVNAELAADMKNMSQSEKESVLSKLGFGKSSKGEFVIGDLTAVSINELKNIFEEVKTDASYSNFDADALGRANLLNRIRGQSEIGQFDENAADYGVQDQLKKGYSDLTQYTKGQSDVQRTAELPENQAFIQNLALNSSAGGIDNVRFDHKAGRADTESLVDEGKSMASAGAFNFLTPTQQAEFLAQEKAILRYGSRSEVAPSQQLWQLIKKMHDTAAETGQKVAAYRKSKADAQREAGANMARYLKNSEDGNLFKDNYSIGDYNRGGNWQG